MDFMEQFYFVGEENLETQYFVYSPITQSYQPFSSLNQSVKHGVEGKVFFKRRYAID